MQVPNLRLHCVKGLHPEVLGGTQHAVASETAMQEVSCAILRGPTWAASEGCSCPHMDSASAVCFNDICAS